MTGRKILIDTDPGDDIDDILALAFALRRPELEVQAITTVTFGAPRRAALVRGLLDSAGKAHIPVGSGLQLPLRQYRLMTDNEEYVLNHCPPARDGDDAAPDAADLIIRTVESNPGEVGIVTLGPLTNLAAALRKQPSIAGRIPWIASMGGEVNVYRAEHNIVGSGCGRDRAGQRNSDVSGHVGRHPQGGLVEAGLRAHGTASKRVVSVRCGVRPVVVALQEAEAGPGPVRHRAARLDLPSRTVPFFADGAAGGDIWKVYERRHRPV